MTSQLPALHQYSSFFVDTNVIVNLIRSDPTGISLNELIIDNSTTYITSTVEEELQNNLSGRDYATYLTWAYNNHASGDVELVPSPLAAGRNAGEQSIIREINTGTYLGPYLVLSGDNGDEADFGTVDVLNSIEFSNSLLLSGEISYARYAVLVAQIGIVAPHEFISEDGVALTLTPGSEYNINGNLVEVRPNGLIVNGVHVGYLQKFEIDPSTGGVSVSGHQNCFLSGTPVRLADGSNKAIEEIAVGDEVQSYNGDGELVASRVSKVFRKQSKHILDVFGLMITPGHVTYCGDGQFKGQHVPIIDILRSDGALMKSDGSLVRAGTGCQVGSEGDALLWVVTGDRQTDGDVAIKQKAQIRAGSRFILDDGRDVCLLDLIKAANCELTDGGYVRSDDFEAPLPFHWIFTDSLPKPEDYVLQRSQVSLGEIYAAAEWDGVPSAWSAHDKSSGRGIITRTAEDIAQGKPNIPLSLHTKPN